MEFGMCKLCLHEKELCNSHIIPEFLYKPLYDKKNRFFALSSDNNKSTKILQKGIREYLLCSECETILSRYETYAKQVFNYHNEIIKNDELLFFKNIDYKKMKLFQLSLLWRAGVSTLDTFKKVTLLKHEDIIRKMIKNENPGDFYKYGCILLHIKKHINITQQMIISPEVSKFGSHHCYYFMTPSLHWIFIVSSHMQQLSAIKKSFLTDQGLPIAVYNNIQPFEKYLIDYAHKLKKAGKLKIS